MDEISSCPSLMVLTTNRFPYEMFLPGSLPGFRHQLEGRGRDPRQNRAGRESGASLIIQDPEAVAKTVLLCACCAVGASSAVLPACRPWKFMGRQHIVTAYLGLSPVKKARNFFPNPRAVVDTLLRAGSPFQNCL